MTGVWRADDDGLYYVRQLKDKSIWWAGLSTHAPQSDFQIGLDFSNVFRGKIQNKKTITGEWVGVPRGRETGYGTLTLHINQSQQSNCLRPDGIKLEKVGENGTGFHGRTWTFLRYKNPPETCDLPCRFHYVKRNNGKPIKDKFNAIFDYNYTYFGTIRSQTLEVNFLPWVPRTYMSFMCVKPEKQAAPWYHGGGEPPDGDIHFDIMTDKGVMVHPELHMYSRSAGKEFCGVPGRFNIPPLLPGWAETGANSVLLNGRPINGNVEIAYPSPGNNNDPCNRMIQNANAGSCTVRSVLGRKLAAGTPIRVTGARVTDEHNTLEIHPVYAIDIMRAPHNAHRTGPPRPDLTGVWDATDSETYYVHQRGRTVWWLGLGNDRGARFANVFQGTVDQRKAFVHGTWVDVSLGGARDTGTLKLRMADSKDGLTLVHGTGGFRAIRWEEMYAPPTSTLSIGGWRPRGAGRPTVTGRSLFTVTATDAGLGVQSVSYRFLRQGSTAPYTTVRGSHASFRLNGPNGRYEIDFYATDGVGNVEPPHITSVYLTNGARLKVRPVDN